MISGEFRLQLPGEGGTLVLKNQFTTFGMQALIRAAFWQEKGMWEIGLCAHQPGDAIPLTAINEPPIGIDGYERVPMPMDRFHWGILGNINGETYIESKPALFEPLTGTTWEPRVNRLFITDKINVIAISSAIPGGLQSISTTISAPYRLYFR